MKVEIGKEYRLANGAPYRLYCVDAGGDYPVHGAYKKNSGWVQISHTLDGINSIGLNLVEVPPYDDFKIDDKVLVWDNDKKHRRYFAGISKNGKALAFDSGKTSWNSKDTDVVEWNNCIKFEVE